MSSSPISTSSLPPINPALEPAAIRNGNQKAKQAYQVGLAFEQMLVDQLAQQLASTSGLDGSSGDGSSGDGSAGSGGSSDPATSMYAQMLPDALTSGVMSSGGLGVAAQIAQSLDPALGGKL
jgi:Rod binding domain-containing protein